MPILTVIKHVEVIKNIAAANEVGKHLNTPGAPGDGFFLIVDADAHACFHRKKGNTPRKGNDLPSRMRKADYFWRKPLQLGDD